VFAKDYWYQLKNSTTGQKADMISHTSPIRVIDNKTVYDQLWVCEASIYVIVITMRVKKGIEN